MTTPELRKAAKEIWETALAAARPATAIGRALEPTADGFTVCGNHVPVPGQLIVIGAGKASAGMAQVIEEMFGHRVSAGLVITKYGHRLPTERIQIFEAGHPVPDETGALAVAGIREILHDLSADDVVLCLISGGASALLPSPAEGITLEEKQEVTSGLLRAGATILELNAVRKHLSSIKGGLLASWAAPARVVSLIMSDVIGDPVDFIASGPTAPDTSTFADALRIIEKYGVPVGAAVSDRLERGVSGEVAETPKKGDPIFERVSNHVIANNRLLVDASAVKARELGFQTMVLSAGVEGEARDVGRLFASMSLEIGSENHPLGRPSCVIAAGETTVTVRGSGAGGRNQEMALAWAIEARDRPESAAFASVATDGTDGPTEAAGAVVDPGTCARGLALALDPDECLRENDSYTFLSAVGDTITTGPTQTNLMDLQLLLIG